jgi:hypothetical protein
MRNALSGARANLIERTGDDARAYIGLCYSCCSERRVLWFADRM